MIVLSNLTLRRSAKVLLDAATLTIHAGEKVGLVGRNGAGKSTLFALVQGTLHEDSGDFSMPAGWRMSSVAQHMPETDEPATAFVLGGDSRLMEAEAELQAAEHTTQQAGESEDDFHIRQGEAIAHAHMSLADAGTHDAPSRAQALILGLGFQVSELEKPVNAFSGGWRMRLQLARALMCPADVLLLDEPTNHLDLDALVWLEGWLKRFEGTMIVISHDREFLDAVTKVTVHIEAGKLTRYGSNYSGFEELRSQQLALQQAAFAKQQDKIAHLQKFIDRFKAKASKAKQAQSRVKALERMEKVAPMIAAGDFTFEFKEPASLPNPMLAITDASFGYVREDDAQPPVTILQGVQRTVLAGQRIGVLGANGQGKSTFVKTVARTLPLLAGQCTEGKGLKIGYFAQQELDVLHEGSNPMEHMVRLARSVGVDAREQELRGYLGSFNFSGEMVHQAVGSMSGGEKARLVLAMVVWQRPNLLLLDEPTNHLDLATREALRMALAQFEGTVMLVSHDRALLRAVCDDFWLVSRGGVQPFDGDLDDYQQFLLDEAKRVREANRIGANSNAAVSIATNDVNTRTDAGFESKKAASEAQKALEAAQTATKAAEGPLAGRDQRKTDAQRRAAAAEKTKPWRKEIEQLDAQMAQLDAERDELEGLMQRLTDGADIALAGRRLKAIADELAEAENRWLSLSERVEAAQAA